MLCTNIVLNVKTKNNFCTQQILNLYFSGNSMNNLLSYYGLTDARMRASEKDLLAQCTFTIRNQILKRLCIQVSKRGYQLRQISDLLCVYFGAAIILAIMKFSILFRWALAIHSKENNVPLEITRTHSGKDPPSKRMTFIHISPCCKGGELCSEVRILRERLD